MSASGDPVELIRQSALFDADWYRQRYPDVALLGLDPAEHYLRVGARLQRDPGPDFSTRAYCERHPALQDQGLNPLVHAVRGQASATPARTPNRQLSRPTRTPPLKVAVAAHVFYPELWPEITSRLKRIDLPYDLYVTLPSPQHEGLRDRVLAEFPQALVQRSANLGMDLAPFLQIVPTLRDLGYDIVCKVHTKRGNADTGMLWRDLALDSLIGDAATFGGIVDAFCGAPELGMLGPAPLFKSAKTLMYTNGPLVHSVFEACHPGLPAPGDWGFFAGTMFWARLSLFTPSRLRAFASFPYDVGRTGGDGTLAHSLERVVCALPVLDGLQLGMVHRLRMAHGDRHALEVADPTFRGMRNGPTGSLQQMKTIADDASLVRESDLLDPDWYLRQRPVVRELGLDPAEHYLVFGETSGASPCRAFDPAAYRRDHQDVARTGRSPLLHYLKAGRHEQRLIRPVPDAVAPRSPA